MLVFDKARIAMGAAELAVDWRVKAPRRVAVLGPSGAGKSTLLEAVAGFRPLLSGALQWEGRDLSACAPEARPVSILFQDNNLFPHLDMRRNLSLALRPDGRRPDPAGLARIDDALARVGLAGLAGRRPAALSGGQQSRAALARVLLQERPVLLLDEPFAALDPARKSEMLELVRDLGDALEALVLMVTHDPRDARDWAQDIVLVSEGAAQAPRAVAEFLADPPQAYRAYLGETDNRQT